MKQNAAAEVLVQQEKHRGYITSFFLTFFKIYVILKLEIKEGVKRMKILSLDLSTKSSGWAVFEDTKLIDYGCITASSDDLIKRIHKMVDELKIIIEKHNIDKIITEEVRPQGGYGVGNLQTHRALMWLQGALAMMIHDNFKNLHIDYILPNSWRAKVGIKTGRGITRTSLKPADIKFVRETFNIDVNDDVADAIGVGYAQVLENNKPQWS